MLYATIVVLLIIIIAIGIFCIIALKQQISTSKNVEQAIYRLIEITKEKERMKDSSNRIK
ncbi:MAG: hypothetical protein NAG76_18150 [Candidatus Pristimantibacillus lignocellulolyticus]|uniref:Uncharacterized protein n=1 Tax=Candidatus Pristimantibacillus lignocellulolyticus TaxID=2994561 RepID=A0A9J6ZC91_9BACL|nr:MAG: hypothetical protein NAG76_18150 [Candidatus Pristimantibacillus lignocellulolyticus]